MRVTYIAAIAAILVLGLGLVIYVGEKKAKKLDLSSETFGIPLTQEQLFKGDFSSLSPPFRLIVDKTEMGDIYNISYSGCNTAVQPMCGNQPWKALFLPAMISVDDKKVDSNTSEWCPFKTNRGIGIGSTKQDILDAYGEPNKVFTRSSKPPMSRPNMCYMVVKDSEHWILEFFLDSDYRVMQIILEYEKTTKKPHWE